jgi:hypothetical protein
MVVICIAGPDGVLRSNHERSDNRLTILALSLGRANFDYLYLPCSYGVSIERFPLKALY